MNFPLTYDGTQPQADFWHNKSRFRAFIGGIGSGKTFAGAMAILREPPSVGMVVTPTSDMTEEPYKTIKKISGSLLSEERRGKGDRWLKLHSGHEIYFRSADNPERLRSYNLGWFWMDEAAQLPSAEAWNIMLGRLRLKPGRGWVTTTPKGFNWLYDTFVTKASLDMSLIKAATKSNILHENREFYGSMVDKYHSQFAAQELDGDFVQIGAGLVKPEYLIAAIPPPGLPVVLGVDLAISEKSSADWTVIVAMTRDPSSGLIYIIEAERHQAAFNDVLNAIKAAAARHKPIMIAIEQTQYQAAVIQELARTTHLPVRGIRPDRDKLTRFAPLLTRYEQKMVRHDPSGTPAWLRDELLSFPEGQHDDGVDAAAYAFHALFMNTSTASAVRSTGRNWSTPI
ncbi:phage terminase large subunit [Gammaproteobacteria bacterium]